MAMRSMRSGGFEDSHSIIQCPQCQTKFAVDTQTLSGLESPRFHCSRCDNVFALEAKPKLPAHSVVDTASRSENTRATTKPTPEPTKAAQVEAIAQNTPAQRSADFSIPPAPPISTPTQTSLPSTDQTQMRFDFSGDALARQPAIDRGPARDLARGLESERPFKTNIPTPAPSPVLQKPAASRWSSFTLIAAPLVFFMSAMIGASYYLSQNAQEADQLLASMHKGLPQVPPAELSIEDAQFRKVALDSGDIAYLISGTLINSSERTFHEIQLEGLAFDANGGLIAKTTVNAGATLAKTRVRALSPSMIKDLQSGKIRNKQELKPGQSEDFTFALLSGEPAKAKYFSARVHSVGE